MAKRYQRVLRRRSCYQEKRKRMGSPSTNPRHLIEPDEHERHDRHASRPSNALRRRFGRGGSYQTRHLHARTTPKLACNTYTPRMHAQHDIHLPLHPKTIGNRARDRRFAGPGRGQVRQSALGRARRHSAITNRIACLALSVSLDLPVQIHAQPILGNLPWASTLS